MGPTRARVRPLLLVCLALLSSAADARIPRSQKAKVLFQWDHPCPANGAQRGKCPGYVIDHIDPLCHGGADAPTNMQWQTIQDAKVKDRWERKLCATYSHR